MGVCWSFSQLRNNNINHLFFSAVVLLCLTELLRVMERKKALKIPFKVDKDHVVSMTLFVTAFFFNVITSYLSSIRKSSKDNRHNWWASQDSCYTCISLPTHLIMTAFISYIWFDFTLRKLLRKVRNMTVLTDPVGSLCLFFFHKVPWTNIPSCKRKHCDSQHKNGSNLFDQKLADKISLEFKR